MNDFVYCIVTEDNKFIKIGHSMNPVNRKNNLQTCNPVKLNLYSYYPGNSSEEKSLHIKFKSLRVIGEWFKYHQDIINHFDNKKTTVIKPIVTIKSEPIELFNPIDWSQNDYSIRETIINVKTEKDSRTEFEKAIDNFDLSLIEENYDKDFEWTEYDEQFYQESIAHLD